MKTQKSKRKLILTAGAAFAALAVVITAAALLFAGTSSQHYHYLVLSNNNCGTLLLKQRVNDGDIFSVGYIHSVNISPVLEIYQIRQDQIFLTAVEFEAFGAGMNADIEPGQVFESLPGGGMRISGFDRVMGEFSYIIGYNTEHTLYLNERQIPLNSLDSAGQPVRFSIFSTQKSQKRR
jgi:hypothetical protein